MYLCALQSLLDFNHVSSKLACSHLAAQYLCCNLYVESKHKEQGITPTFTKLYTLTKMPGTVLGSNAVFRMLLAFEFLAEPRTDVSCDM